MCQSATEAFGLGGRQRGGEMTPSGQEALSVAHWKSPPKIAACRRLAVSDNNRKRGDNEGRNSRSTPIIA